MKAIITFIFASLLIATFLVAGCSAPGGSGGGENQPEGVAAGEETRSDDVESGNSETQPNEPVVD